MNEPLEGMPVQVERGPRVFLNTTASLNAIAEKLATVASRCPAPTRRPWGDDIGAAIRGELLLATLCHAMNEDRLLSRLQSQPDLIRVEILVSLSSGALADWLGLDPCGEGKRSPLALANLVAEQFREIDEHGLARLERLCTPTASEDDVNAAVNWLTSLPAFREDPLQKKVALVLQRLHLTGYAESEGIAHHIPLAIDKHLVRLALRLGLVAVSDRTLAQKVAERGVLSAGEDEELRRNVRDALQLLCGGIRLSIPWLNYVLWQFSRSCCTRSGPLCVLSQRELLGVASALSGGSVGCPFQSGCWAHEYNSVLSTLDPVMRGARY